MFVPRHFQVEDEKQILTFIQKYSFATLITYDEVKPVASHIPILLRHIDSKNVITGHVAYANEQWKTFQENSQALLIFQGPHAYVSSSWYDHENVSTWNYQAVHIYGPIQEATKEQTIDDVRHLQNHYETARPNAVTWDTLTDNTKQQVQGIVGFRMTIDSIKAAYKMSQNRNETDYQSIIDHLKQEQTYEAKAVANVMKKLKR